MNFAPSKKIHLTAKTNMMKTSNRYATALAALAVVHMHDDKMYVEGRLRAGDAPSMRH